MWQKKKRSEREKRKFIPFPIFFSLHAKTLEGEFVYWNFYASQLFLQFALLLRTETAWPSMFVLRVKKWSSQSCYIGLAEETEMGDWHSVMSFAVHSSSTGRKIAGLCNVSPCILFLFQLLLEFCSNSGKSFLDLEGISKETGTLFKSCYSQCHGSFHCFLGNLSSKTPGNAFLVKHARIELLDWSKKNAHTGTFYKSSSLLSLLKS